ncbi:hypothetical protein [Nocardia neocaledoniensis]|uniref:hypothetical protein n=1 Tax=Nocardia neocaledoniensis TaxID=236511 RepID=UPI002456D072|nr:hypothetical protein [Nocardia neocaledoniensis]
MANLGHPRRLGGRHDGAQHFVDAGGGDAEGGAQRGIVDNELAPLTPPLESTALPIDQVAGHSSYRAGFTTAR